MGALDAGAACAPVPGDAAADCVRLTLATPRAAGAPGAGQLDARRVDTPRAGARDAARPDLLTHITAAAAVECDASSAPAYFARLVRLAADSRAARELAAGDADARGGPLADGAAADDALLVSGGGGGGGWSPTASLRGLEGTLKRPARWRSTSAGSSGSDAGVGLLDARGFEDALAGPIERRPGSPGSDRPGSPGSSGSDSGIGSREASLTGSSGRDSPV